MIHTKLSAVCCDQSLRISSAPTVASGGVNETILTVEFSSHWDGFEKTAVFYRNEENVYHVLMENDSCLVPKEVLSEAGCFCFGIMGACGDTVRTSSVVRYTVMKGSVTESTAISDPTPDIYSQLICRIAVLEDLGNIPNDGTVVTGFLPDETLSLENRVLSVNTADKAEENNPLPISSAAVYDEIGNIAAVLSTI